MVRNGDCLVEGGGKTRRVVGGGVEAIAKKKRKENKRRDSALLLLHSSIFSRSTARYSKLYELRECVCCLLVSPSHPSPLRLQFYIEGA
jgi:hypothetical protein